MILKLLQEWPKMWATKGHYVKLGLALPGYENRQK